VLARRPAQHGRARRDRAIEAVEEQIRWCRLWNGRTEDDVPKFEGERIRLEKRLRDLLDEPDEDGDGS